ncbi:MAG TPA: hydrolase, partial [Polyangiales bacterium]|nr:hydrolase [Polyangiales bacterium]
LHVHGTQDPLIPYAGGPDGLGQPIEWTAVADEMALWRRRDRCSGEAEQVYGRGDATCQEWSCDEQSHVQLCTIDGGGHTWPGLAPDALPPQLGKTSQDLNANQHILDFFEQHTLR